VGGARRRATAHRLGGVARRLVDVGKGRVRGHCAEVEQSRRLDTTGGRCV
jgi:hypothetical protein